ncbi:hypothetical protein G210_3268 [Candida maltosa Xu316]|uniref:Uncharacterized protein n=1 Tax=Candida maltosa (strain Xu316) TaxID=1245528 RepID=M3J3K2_CANMX|nr:hypothetical protein G210_3268 [Candida maltosa Xu316]
MNHKIPKPDLQSIKSPPPSNLTSPIQPTPIPSTHDHDDDLPPSNLTDIEDTESLHNIAKHMNRSPSISSENVRNLSHSVSIKLSELPNTSSSSLLIGGGKSKSGPGRKEVPKSGASSIRKEPIDFDETMVKEDEPTKEEVVQSPIQSPAQPTTSKELPDPPVASPQIPKHEDIETQTQTNIPPIITPPELEKTNKQLQKVTESIQQAQQESASPALSQLSPQLDYQTHQKRASMMSTFSHQSTGIAEEVSVRRSTSKNLKYVAHSHSKQGSLDNSTNKYDNYDGDSTDYDETSSLLMGKLPTITKTPKKSEQTGGGNDDVLNPEKSFVTSIEGSIPARSPRRPTSQILSNFNIDESMTHDGDVDDDEDDDDEDGFVYEEVDDEMDAELKKQRESMVIKNRRRSTQISDDLDRLMSDASGFGITYPDDEEEQHNDHDENDDTPKINPLVVDSATKDPIITNADLDDTASKKSALPPRPTKDNINKARIISSSYQEKQIQQQTQQETPTIIKPENDDNSADYYDIEDDEPSLIIHKPKAKSVKNSIKRHNNAQPSGTTRRKKSIKGGNKRDSKSGKKNELKPFNYTTLISLLESMNGTIIGEEFNSLNIPIKEKQLIEKIIDSLSRLTSDMILDQRRYEIGIERLENCLRVLEGFM